MRHAPPPDPRRAGGPSGERLVAVLGATATGKSLLAAELARALGGDVVSFDASCLHRGLDVCTAKPGPELRAKAPHHLVGVLDPREEPSAARFVEMAQPVLEELAARGRPAVLVGGTGLYLRALLHGLPESPAPRPDLRRRLEERERRRPGSLHRLLRRLDPVTARRTPEANVPRIVRALEHRLLTGRRLGEERTWSRPARRPAVKVGLFLPRSEREERIRRRCEEMLAAGLLDEVRRLLDAGVPETAPAFRALGSRDAARHLRGEIDRDELLRRMVVATRQYAKRQDTWFRKEPGVLWLSTPRRQAELPVLVERVMMAAETAWARG